MPEREPIEVTNLDRYGSAACRGAGRATILAAPPRERRRWPDGFLGTSRPDGRPHAARVGALWYDGDVYIASGPGTRKSRNLAENPACTISMSLEGIDLVLEGEATRVTDRPTLEAVAGLYRAQGGRRKWRARPSRRRTARRARDRRPGTSTALRSTRSSVSPPPSRTARPAGGFRTLTPNRPALTPLPPSPVGDRRGGCGVEKGVLRGIRGRSRPDRC